jgi:hypothetical protein
MSFRIVYAFLALVLGATLAVGTFALGRGTRHPAATHAAPAPRGTTSFQVSSDIAKRVTAHEPAGLEAGLMPKVLAMRLSQLRLSGLQVPLSQGAVQLMLAPDDVVYQICGHGPECSLTEAPSTSREIVLRRVALDLAVETFSAPHAPQRVLVSLPAQSGQLWLVYYDRAGLNAALLVKARLMLQRLSAPKARMRNGDAVLLSQLTDGRTFAVSGQVTNEDGDVIDILQQRACMDVACPGKG